MRKHLSPAPEPPTHTTPVAKAAVTVSVNTVEVEEVGEEKKSN